MMKVVAVALLLALACGVLSFDPSNCSSWNLCGNLTLIDSPGSFVGCCQSVDNQCSLDSDPSVVYQIGKTKLASGWYLMVLNKTTVADSNIQIYLPVLDGNQSGSLTTWSIGIMGPTEYSVLMTADCTKYN